MSALTVCRSNARVARRLTRDGTNVRPVVALLAAVALFTATPTFVRAQQPAGVSLTLSKYNRGEKQSLLVLPIRGTNGDSIATIIGRDLDFGDRFTVVPAASVMQTDGPFNYGVYAKLGVQGVVQGTLLASGWVRVVLHDVGGSKILNQKDFPLTGAMSQGSWRHQVHTISDAIEEWVTGQRGIATTRIAFERDRRIWTVDQDGANLRAVTSRGLSPQWTPSGQAIVYMGSIGGDDPVLVTDLSTGAQRTLSAAKGIQAMSPNVSPDGRRVVFTRVSGDGADLYSVPFEGGAPQRITVGRGKGSYSPAFSPDGQRIVFSSDRSGRSEVYISDVDGTNVEALAGGSFGERADKYSPDWSPDGQFVAYHAEIGGTPQIVTLSLRDQAVRQVTSDGRNEDASWAPDSRHLVFTSFRSGNRQLWVVDRETGRTRQLTRGAEARLGAWSPRLTNP
ncbi:MAG: hypothetical protein V4617_05895 [Gemmatimonadota bacterium]